MVYLDQLRYGEFESSFMLECGVVNNILLEFHRLMPLKFADQNMKP